MMNNGILLVDKPEGITSNNLVLELKKHLNVSKAGHTGTLDYSASGLMIITLGKATRFTEYFQKLDKEYITIGKLGEITDTYDREGKVIEKIECDVSESDIKKAVYSFIGSYPQIPPPFSSKRIKGKRAYQLAKRGLNPELKPVVVNIYDIEILNINFPYFEIKVECSSGTYIRSLVKDIGDKLNCGAYVYSLRRTKIGLFNVEDAKGLEEILRMPLEEVQKLIIPLEKALYFFPEIKLDEGYDLRFKYGQRFKIPYNIKGLAKVFSSQNKFLGIGEVKENRILQPLKVIKD